MKNFEFKSAICTSVEQSKRLLELGLKKETADCALLPLTDKVTSVLVKPSTKDIKNTIPAWSLDRLIEMLNKSGITISFLERDTSIIVERYGVFQQVFEIWDNVYDNIIDCIEWLINEGYFNKEYWYE